MLFSTFKEIRSTNNMSPNPVETQLLPNVGPRMSQSSNMKELTDGLIELAEISGEFSSQCFEAEGSSPHMTLPAAQGAVASSSRQGSSSDSPVEPGISRIEAVVTCAAIPISQSFSAEMCYGKQSTSPDITSLLIDVSENDFDNSSKFQPFVFPELEQMQTSEDYRSFNKQLSNLRQPTLSSSYAISGKHTANTAPNALRTSYGLPEPQSVLEASNPEGFSPQEHDMRLDSENDLTYLRPVPSTSGALESLSFLVSDPYSNRDSSHVSAILDIQIDLGQILPSNFSLGQIDVLSTYDFDIDTEIGVSDNAQPQTLGVLKSRSVSNTHSCDNLTKIEGTSNFTYEAALSSNQSLTTLINPIHNEPLSALTVSDQTEEVSGTPLSSGYELPASVSNYGSNETLATNEFFLNNNGGTLKDRLPQEMKKQKPCLLLSSSDTTLPINHERHFSLTMPKLRHQFSLPCDAQCFPTYRQTQDSTESGDKSSRRDVAADIWRSTSLSPSSSEHRKGSSNTGQLNPSETMHEHHLSLSDCIRLGYQTLYDTPLPSVPHQYPRMKSVHTPPPVSLVSDLISPNLHILRDQRARDISFGSRSPLCKDQGAFSKKAPSTWTSHSHAFSGLFSMESGATDDTDLFSYHSHLHVSADTYAPPVTSTPTETRMLNISSQFKSSIRPSVQTGNVVPEITSTDSPTSDLISRSSSLESDNYHIPRSNSTFSLVSFQSGSDGASNTNDPTQSPRDSERKTERGPIDKNKSEMVSGDEISRKLSVPLISLKPSTPHFDPSIKTTLRSKLRGKGPHHYKKMSAAEKSRQEISERNMQGSSSNSSTNSPTKGSSSSNLFTNDPTKTDSSYILTASKKCNKPKKGPRKSRTSPSTSSLSELITDEDANPQTNELQIPTSSKISNLAAEATSSKETSGTSPLRKSDEAAQNPDDSGEILVQRRKNRLASRACRLKRQEKMERLLSETKRLEERQSRIQAEIRKWLEEKRKLEEMLERHEPHCKMRRTTPSSS